MRKEWPHISVTPLTVQVGAGYLKQPCHWLRDNPHPPTIFSCFISLLLVDLLLNLPLGCKLTRLSCSMAGQGVATVNMSVSQAPPPRPSTHHSINQVRRADLPNHVSFCNPEPFKGSAVIASHASLSVQDRGDIIDACAEEGWYHEMLDTSVRNRRHHRLFGTCVRKRRYDRIFGIHTEEGCCNKNLKYSSAGESLNI